ETEPELLNNIVRSLHNLCSITQQAVTTPVAAVQDVAWHSQHVAPLLERTSRCNKGTALFARLYHHDRPPHPADDAISTREEVCLRRRARYELAHDGASRHDVGHQCFMFARIGHVGSAAQNGHRATANGKGAAMCRGIDAARQTARDHDSSRTE